VLPNVLTPQIVLDALRQGNTVSEKAALKNATDSVASNKNKAPALILQGRSLQQAGKQAEAKAKFEEALMLDPGNLAARHYLSLLLQAAEPPGSNPYPRTNLVQSDRGEATIQESDFDDIIRNRIREQFGDRATFIKFLQTEGITYETYRQRERNRIKLDSIRFEEVSFPGLPLNEVVEKLAAMVAATYREHKGINFIVATNDIIHLDRPLRNVTLRQTLDAIVRTAETSLTYSVEDYAVVISPGPRRPLHTRWFRIDPNTFRRSVSESATKNMDQAIKEAISAPPVLADSPSPGKVYRTSVTPTGQQEQVNSEARRFFTKAGVDFTVPGKSLVHNERLGQIVVRATLQDLDIIEQALQKLNTPPPQVTIEVKFAEITDADSKALGFDWFLRNTLTQNSGLGPQIGLFATSATSVGLPVNPAASTDNLLNLFQAFRNHPLPALPSSIAANAQENEPLTGILTDSQFRVVLRALEQRQGVNILTPPKVTTLSGRQAQVKTVKVRYVVTDLDLSQIVSNATTGAPSEVQPKPIAEPFELGPVLDVVPYVQSDWHTIQMTVIPTLTEFLGYDVENAHLVPPQAKSADMQQLTPLPIFRKRQIVSSVIARDGQTVVLAGGSDQLLANPNKNEPLREGTKPPQEPKKTKLLIFVTATLIDPAGNRIHPPEDVPRGDPTQASTPPSR
jgi:general secretion pathway protein D